MGQQCDLDNRETIDEGDNADIWSHDSGGGCRNCAAVGIWALKNKMSVAFAPQDILSENSANNNYDGMKNIPVPGIELKEKMRQNAVSYSVYDLLDVTAHEDNLDKLEVYALYDSGRNDCTHSVSADGRSLSFPDYGVYDMHVRITCKNGTKDHVRISVPINRKVVGL